jgi:hypothetical protein
VEESARLKGPERQYLYRDGVVPPGALDQEGRELLRRVQHAINSIVRSKIYAADLQGTLSEPVLRRHEWQIAVELREITELMLELSSHTAGTTGPMTSAVLEPQKRAISLARDATAARVAAIESLAAQMADADVVRLDWETAHQLAANNDRYLDLVARTAADQVATVEITGLAEHAAMAARALRETLQQVTLAAQALVLPEPQSRKSK